MKESTIDRQAPIPPHDQSAVVVEPREGPFDQDTRRLPFSEGDPGVRGEDDDGSAAVSQDFHSRPDDHPHTGEAAREAFSSGDRPDDALFAFPHINQQDKLILHIDRQTR